MKQLWMGLACVVLATTAAAGGVEAARKRTVGSMMATGSIDVLSDGKVGHYDIDQSSMLPAAVLQVISHIVPTWQFEPVVQNGMPVTSHSKMSLRVVANPVEGGKYAVSIDGADFGREVAGVTEAATDSLSEHTTPEPTYPRDLAAEHVTGTVYVLLRVDRSGHVEMASAQKVNLRVVADERSQEMFRKKLAFAATSAVRHWTFNVPTTGKDVDQPCWWARVPIRFSTKGEHVPGYGEWEVYDPGPLEPVVATGMLPTVTHDKLLSANVDATPAGGSVLSASGLHLITRLVGS